MRKMGLLPLFGSMCLILAILALPSMAQAWQWPKSITVLGGSIGDSRYVSMIAWASVMEAATGMKIRVVPEDNDVRKAKRIKQGDGILGKDGISAVVRAIEAPKQYTIRDGGPYQIRGIYSAGWSSLGFIVRANSDIKTVHDLKPGHRWPSMPFMPPYQETTRGVFAWAQVDEKDLVAVPVSNWPAAVKAVVEKKVDISYCPTNSAFTFEVAASPVGIRWLELNPKKDPEGAKRYLKKKPTLGFAPCKHGVTSARGIWMCAVLSLMYGNADSEPELIYNMVKWWDENYDAYKDKHEQCQDMDINSVRSSFDYCYLPLHEGTIRYFKEKGMWAPTDDARQKKALDLVSMYVEAYEAAIADADKKGIKIDPSNEEWLNIWNSHKKDIPRFKVELY